MRPLGRSLDKLLRLSADRFGGAIPAPSASSDADRRFGYLLQLMCGPSGLLGPSVFLWRCPLGADQSTLPHPHETRMLMDDVLETSI